MLKLSRQRTDNQRGDTIVEVLIAVAIISLVLVVSYASANRNTRMTRDTLEHNQALQLVQAQIERLRTLPAPSAGGCYDSTGSAVTGGGCVFAGDGSANPTGAVQPAYTLSISGPDANGVRQVKAQWDSLLPGVTTAQVSIYYGT